MAGIAAPYIKVAEICTGFDIGVREHALKLRYHEFFFVWFFVVRLYLLG